HAWVQDDVANVLPWHGSPVSLPNTGAVHVEPVTSSPVAQPGSRFRPKKYWVPSSMVTFQCSPSLSPLLAPVNRCTRVPSSLRGCHSPVASSRTSSTALLPSVR